VVVNVVFDLGDLPIQPINVRSDHCDHFGMACTAGRLAAVELLLTHVEQGLQAIDQGA